MKGGRRKDEGGKRKSEVDWRTVPVRVVGDLTHANQVFGKVLMQFHLEQMALSTQLTAKSSQLTAEQVMS